MKLTMVDRAAQGLYFIPRLIPLLATKPLGEIFGRTLWVAALLAPLLERHRGAIAVMKERVDRKTTLCSSMFTDHDLEGYNKFVPIICIPNPIYSVGLRKAASG